MPGMEGKEENNSKEWSHDSWRQALHRPQIHWVSPHSVIDFQGADHHTLRAGQSSAPKEPQSGKSQLEVDYQLCPGLVGGTVSRGWHAS